MALAERYIMITRRAYRNRLGVVDARRLINNMADGHLRPAIPRALLKVLTDYPPGILVRLVNEEIAVVTGRPVHARGPFVKAIINPRGERYNGTFERIAASWITTSASRRSPKPCHPWTGLVGLR